MKYVVANWKMNMDMPSVVGWFNASPKMSHNPSQVTVIVAPAFLHIPFAFLALDEMEGLEMASQDISHYEKGSHTGENGGFQIKEFCKYCIVGHSERKESLDLVLQKRDLALKQGLIPIVCFVSPEDAPKYYVDGTILAWEDPANISGGGDYKEKPVEEVRKNVEKIKDLLPKEAVLLYGGSVNRDNIEDLADLDSLDGALVGQASLDPSHFFELIKAYEISRS